LSRRDRNSERQKIRLPYGRATTIISPSRPQIIILIVAHLSPRLARYIRNGQRLYNR